MGVEESVYADICGKAAGLSADCVGNASEGKVVSLEPVLKDQLLGAWHRSEVPADQSVHRALPDIALGISHLIPDAEAGARDKREMPRGLHSLVSAVDGFVQFNGVLDPDEGIDCDAVPVADQADRLIRGHDFIHK